MAVAILKQGDVLIVAVQGPLPDKALTDMRDELADKVGRFRARGVVIDVTALDVLDSFATRTILQIARVARLRGAHTAVVGIQPEVAFAMVQLGLSLHDVTTALDLEDALASLRRSTGAQVR